MRQTRAELLILNTDLAKWLQAQTVVASQYYAQIQSLEKQLNQMGYRFDRLLEGMCMGMKEANLPRRAS